MFLRYNIFLILFLALTGRSVYPQGFIKGIVIAKETKIPIAFASVAYQKQSVQQGTITDSHGEFKIPVVGIEKLFVSCIGYEKKTILLNPGINLKNIIIELKTDTLNINEIIVTPANNPALRIIRNTMMNKEKNNFENYEKYRYQCYFKTILNVKISYTPGNNDSIKGGNKSIGDGRPRFISESVVLCSRINKRTDNKIIAVKTSGFENTFLGQYFFTLFHNSISFYNNNIALFAIPIADDKTNSEYLSPLSNECLRSYNYNLEETFENLTDTTYLIEFHPKKETRFNGLRGKIYISSNGYAIKNIVAEPSDKGLIDFKFRQDYEFIGNRWFPSRLDEEISFVNVKINRKINAYPVYLITSQISNVDYTSPLTSDSIKTDKVYLDNKSIKNSDTILKTARIDSLSLPEKDTYELMKRIGKKYKFDLIAEIYPNLITGKIPIKFINIDLFKLFYSNAYEGQRPGLGLSTNQKFSKIVSVGGFVGYGLKDQKLKYGGHLDLNIDRDKEILFRISYQNNLKEPGLDLIDDNNLLSLGNYYRNYIASRMDNFIEEKAEISFRLFSHLKISAAISLKEIKPTYDLKFMDLPLVRYQSDEAQFSIRYAFGEEVTTFGTNRITTYQGNPVVSLKYKRGIDLFHPESYIYNRSEAAIDFSLYKGRLGQSTIRLAGGYIDNIVPYGLLFTGEGSKSSYPLIINNTFQTMMPYEFLSDRYLNLFYTHNFGSLLFERPKFKPKFLIAHNMGWGTLRNASYQGIDFKEKNNIYLESGLMINNIIAFKIVNLYHVGFGGGAFYRYGYYRNDKITDNLALKLSFMVTYK